MKLNEEIARLNAINSEVRHHRDTAEAADLRFQGRWPLRQASFVYVPTEDVYRCPAGERLTYRFTGEEDGKKLRRCPTAPAIPAR